MHEYHAVENVVKQAAEAARKNGALSVTRVALVVGELSGFEESSVRLYFENISKGTAAENAELVIHPVRAKLKCRKCGELFERREKVFECPKCGGMGSPTETGKEFYIKNVEIES